MIPRPLVGDVLQKTGLLDDRQLEAALSHRQANGGKFGEAVVALSFVPEQRMLEALAKELDVPLMPEEEVSELNVPADVRGSIPRFLAEEELVFPLTLDAERGLLTIVTHEPLDEPTLDGLRIFANVDQIRLCLTTRNAMRKLIARHLAPEVAAVAAARAPHGPPDRRAESAPAPAAPRPPSEPLRPAPPPPRRTQEERPAAALTAANEGPPGALLDELVAGDRPHVTVSGVTPTAWDDGETAASRILPFREPEPPPSPPPRAAVQTGSWSPAGVSPPTAERPLLVPFAEPTLAHDSQLAAEPDPSRAAAEVSALRAPPPPEAVRAPEASGLRPPALPAATAEKPGIQFLFDLWDLSLRLLGPGAAADRRRARARAELARDLALELDLGAHEVDEIYLGAFVYDLDETLERAGWAEDDDTPTRGLLARARCPFVLDDFLAGPIGAATLRDPGRSLRLRIVSVAQSYVAEGPPSGLSVQGTLQRMPWAYDVPDLTIALLRALGRRGEILLPEPAKGSEVVIIDPDVRSAGALGLRFVADGAPVRTFADGAAAFVYLRERGATLVISETKVPGIAGLDLCQAVQEDPGVGPVPFFFLSADADPQVITRALELGAEDYFLKPVNVELLLIKAKRAIAR